MPRFTMRALGSNSRKNPVTYLRLGKTVKNKQTGFTLIELMIAVVVVSVLAAIALPNYRNHVRKSVRAEAQAFLLAVAGRQQQFLTDTRGYATTYAATGISTPGNVDAAYTLAIAVPAGTPPTFTLTATPKGNQVGEPCGAIGIDQNGTKTAAKSGCW